MGQTNRLTAAEVRSKREPGRYGDGGGLYLEVLDNGARRWLFRYQLSGRRRDMTLGALSEENGLAKAREAAQDARSKIRQRVDPIDERRRPDAAPTFRSASLQLIEALAPGWRNAHTRARWERCLLTYAAPLGPRPVDELATADVLTILRPKWTVNPETAAKLRECVERVFDAQRAAGAIRGPWENPARWRGNLAFLLPKRKRLSRGHHPAMPYADAPAFMTRLRAQGRTGARALEFAILTACREGIVRAARWEEIDLGRHDPLWTVPAAKMKMEKALRVPLSPAAVALLQSLGPKAKGWIFPGQRQRGRPAPHISDATMDAVLKRMQQPYVPHGFRSTFRDWAGDCTHHQRELVEEALAHRVGDETERAYRRSDALEKRRVLMDDWAAYLAEPTSLAGQ